MNPNASEQEVSTLRSPVTSRVARPRKTYSRRNLRLLPDDLETNYSKWFYGDISKMRSRPKNTPPNRFSSKSKNLPSQRRKFDRITPNNFVYLTENIEPPEIMPIRKITSYTLSCREKDIPMDYRDIQEPCCSENLLNEASSSGEPSILENIEATRPPIVVNESNQRVRQFQLTLKPQITIIDSRPMMKKNLMRGRASLAQKNNTTINGKQTPPLITIEEDCDGTDDDEIIEIDCDTGSRYKLKV